MYVCKIKTGDKKFQNEVIISVIFIRALISLMSDAEPAVDQLEECLLMGSLADPASTATGGPIRSCRARSLATRTTRRGAARRPFALAEPL